MWNVDVVNYSHSYNNDVVINDYPDEAFTMLLSFVTDECSAGVCDNVTCLNGGHCAILGPDNSSCQCPLGVIGQQCQSSKSAAIVWLRL